MKKELLTLRNEQLRLEIESDHLQDTEQDWLDLFEYGNLLDLPVTLSQFIPCKDGKPLEKPSNWDLIQEQGLRSSIIDTMSSDEIQAIEAYRTAFDAVIFDGWEYVDEKLIENGIYIIDLYFGKIRTHEGWQLIAEIKNLSDLAQATIEKPIKLKTK